MNEILDLVPIWTLILALAVFFYVLLDGFDLGVGMLYGLAPDTRSRGMATITSSRPVTAVDLVKGATVSHYPRSSALAAAL
jgi:cytochrome bd ubiquinol oxidase subunit II